MGFLRVVLTLRAARWRDRDGRCLVLLEGREAAVAVHKLPLLVHDERLPACTLYNPASRRTTTAEFDWRYLQNWL